MSYVQSSLMNGEKIILFGSIHRADLYFSFTISTIGLSFSLLGFIYLWPIFISGVFLVCQSWAKISSTEVAVTNKRIIIKVGHILRNTVELPLNKVESISASQNKPGEILGFGTIYIKSIGPSTTVIPKVCDPFRFQEIASSAVKAHK
ncbi:hypothetical protein AEP_01625 [Curvibacter sp. AEP1-3]|uniref:PH domain-containing protein n=1 Tax=Curvibacter sp. AEP1-3 TaxID=1844971 RepID=UPI000B3D1416|nr:PH domain-containing protein [Curvibacter sp. AEP1-3]ARV18569.1 hypothetical protein AEP_01625 [Curvibacter sp. AEP1-3]